MNSDPLFERILVEHIFGLQEQNLSFNQSKNTKEIFAELCRKKVELIASNHREFMEAIRFISLVDKINNKFPFVILPYFIDDFFHDKSLKWLMTRYHLISYTDIMYLLNNILKINTRNFKRQESFEENLKIREWKKIYEFITAQSRHFDLELTNLLNYNAIRAIIIAHIFSSKGTLDEADILDHIIDIVESKYSNMKVFEISKLRQKLFHYLKGNAPKIVEDILIDLRRNRYVRKERNGHVNILKLNESYQQISEGIMNTLRIYPHGLRHDSLIKKLLNQYPLLRLVPEMGLLESKIEELERNNVIKRIPGIQRFSPYQDLLFLYDDLKKRLEELEISVKHSSRKAFFGRAITPNKFFEEIELLEKGNFHDIDDQVTRIAGLILIGIPFLRSPEKGMELFDFSIDLSDSSTMVNGTFLGILGIDKMGTVLNHVRVMLHEEIDNSFVYHLKSSIPDGEGALLVSFSEITKDIRDAIEMNNNIQVIGKEDIRELVKIAKRIPSRVGSIVKVMYGPDRGKLVKIDSVDYESGLASVTLFPTGEDSSLDIGSLQEISIGDSANIPYLEFAANYESFLKQLASNSGKEDFEKGLGNPEIELVKYTLEDYSTQSKTICIDLLDKVSVVSATGGVPSGIFGHYGVKLHVRSNGCSSNIKYNNYSDMLSSTNISNPSSAMRKYFACECFQWRPVANYFNLCSHLICALDIVARKMNCLDETWGDKNNNIMTKLLNEFAILSNYFSMEKLVKLLSEEQIPTLISFVQTSPRVGYESKGEDLDIYNRARKEILEGQTDTRDRTEFLLEKVEKMIYGMKINETERVISYIQYYSGKRRRFIL
jgi:hypothetical protein